VGATASWQAVKSWELWQDSAGAVPLIAFSALAPSALHQPTDAIDGSRLATAARTAACHELEALTSPAAIDLGQVGGWISGLHELSGQPEAARLAAMIAHQLRALPRDRGPDEAGGWSPREANPTMLVNPAWEAHWRDAPAGERAALTSTLLREWLARCASFPRERYRDESIGGIDYVPNGFQDARLADQVWYAVCEFRRVGVDDALLGRLIDWAAGMWPRAPWALLRSAATTPRLHLLITATEDGDDRSLEVHVGEAGLEPIALRIYDGEALCAEARPEPGRSEVRVVLRGLADGTHRFSARGTLPGGELASMLAEAVIPRR
jgi:hypothetical protein